MTAIPSHERLPPLKMPWLQVWRHALARLKDLDVWAPTVRPLLDEYVFALKAAHDAREGFAWLDRLGDVAQDEIEWVALQQIAGGLPMAWDRHVKRAALLADQLCLTPRGLKAAGLIGRDDGDESNDPFAEIDELAPLRQRPTNVKSPA